MIPAFSVSGALPPFTGGDPTERVASSAYATEMVQIVQRFGITQSRNAILMGLLDYRRDLRNLGIVDGFQWIDGSFVEDVEGVRGRPPKDVDIVTVAQRPTSVADNPAWLSLIHSNLRLFDPTQTKAVYKVDGYFIDLNKSPEFVVEDTAYWFGLFSYQRQTRLWKGLLRVPLASDDSAARQLLEIPDA